MGLDLGSPLESQSLAELQSELSTSRLLVTRLNRRIDLLEQVARRAKIFRGLDERLDQALFALRKEGRRP